MSTIQPSRIVCTSCTKPKHELKRRKSKLIEGMTLYLCDSCVAAKNEPRFVILLVARQDGPAAVQEFIKHRRYIGADIKIDDLI